MARRRKSPRKPRTRPAGAGSARNSEQARRGTAGSGQTWLPWLILSGVTFLAYANAWPDVLVFDDKEFLAGGRFSGLSASDFAGLFAETLWEASGNRTALYRPMLLLMLGLESAVFGSWWAGYHLFNIFLHLVATLLVFGFVRALLPAVAYDRRLSHWAALMAAMVFGVHPALSETVNSVFNGSEIHVTIAVVASLWILLSKGRSRPLLAWAVVSFLYLWGLLFRENAVVLPVLAFMVLWLTGREPWLPRIRHCLPVLVLLVPLAMYLGLRSQALEPPAGSVTGQATAEVALLAPAMEASSQPTTDTANKQRNVSESLGLRFDLDRAGQAAKVWFDGLKLMVWPSPLIILHEPSRTPLWLAVFCQLALLTVAVLAYLRGRPAFLFGLAFFYLAILPSSRIVSEGMLQPFLLERMLYLPSVGLVIALAGGIVRLAQVFSLRSVIAVCAVLVLALAPVTWARNHDWSDELRLLEGDLAKEPNSGMLLISVVKASSKAGKADRSVALCKEHSELAKTVRNFANECGKVYASVGRYGQAEEMFLLTKRDGRMNHRTQFELARLYVRMERREEARQHFDEAQRRERQPFLREIFTAVALMDLYPHDRLRLEQARSHLETALEHQPKAVQARELLGFVEHKLKAKRPGK